MVNMHKPSFSIDKGVIKKDKDKMTKKGFNHVIHETLDGGWHITKAEGHH